MKTAVASFVASALLSTLASASTYTVAVGQNGFRFTPNNTVASIGDKVEFHYYPKNHSVVQGDFSHACMNDNGFYSGYVPVAAGSSVSRLIFPLPYLPPFRSGTLIDAFRTSLQFSPSPSTPLTQSITTARNQPWVVTARKAWSAASIARLLVTRSLRMPWPP